MVAKCDATLNDVPDEVRGFPTIKMYPAGKKDAPVEYSGDRSLESLVQFIKEEGTHGIEVSLDGVFQVQDEGKAAEGAKEKTKEKVKETVDKATAGDGVHDEL